MNAFAFVLSLDGPETGQKGKESVTGRKARTRRTKAGNDLAKGAGGRGKEKQGEKERERE